jgi:hypothetical protein
MDQTLISALRARTSTIRDRWEALLRVEHVSGPLANPDTLTYLIPSSIDQILTKLAQPNSKPVSLEAARALARPACNCGCNPYLAYYVAGEQALIEVFVQTQSETTNLTNREADLAAFFMTVRTLSTEDIEAFCEICTHRCARKGCRFGVDAGAACTLRTS